MNKKKLIRNISILTLTLSLIFSLIPNINIEAAKQVTTSTSINSNQLVEVASIVGHYQFNIAAGSNINAKGNRGYSHVESMAQYEKDHSSTVKGNSSGGFLDGSQNENGSIYKAYLVVETSTSDYSLPDYPITFVSGNTNQILKTKVEYYCFTETYSSGNVRRSGYIDVTDFIKQNGYGWYYCCNIPYSTNSVSSNSDQFAGWKLIVIEENYELPMRMLKLQLGCQNINGAGQSSELEISGDGITTATTKVVTGQFLFGMAGADPSASQQNNKITYADTNQMSNNEDNPIVYKNITTKNNVRTSKNPLNFISSKNGQPLQMQSNYEDENIYFKNGSFSKKQTEGSILTGSGDLELLNIDSSSSYYHNVAIAQGQSRVLFRFETVTDVALMTSVLGMAIDIDVPEYVHDYTMAYDEEEGVFHLTGTISNVTQYFSIGLAKNPQFVINFDENLSVKDYSARLTSLGDTDAGKVERILGSNEIQIDKKSNKIIFSITSNKSTDGNATDYSQMNVKNDVLYYSVDLTVNKVRDNYSTYLYTTGNLYTSAKVTSLYLDKLAIKEINCGLQGLDTKTDYTVKIIWDDNNDAEGLRPTYLNIGLCMDYINIYTQEISGRDNEWTFDFKDLDIYRTLDYRYVYTAEIAEKLDNYVPIYSEDGWTITMKLRDKVPTSNIVDDYSLEIITNICNGLSSVKTDESATYKLYNIDKIIEDTYVEILNSN